MAKEAKSDATVVETGDVGPRRTGKKLIILLVAALFALVCVAGGRRLGARRCGAI